ncbi:hypothetical protein GCM10010279_33810 [Streptomyces mutabilis]|nr:hypothetical protein GCM10010279_33810 [Streptomyces mutabilis]
MLPTETNPMLGPDSFGHTGRGGSLAFADPEHGMACGYSCCSRDPNGAQAWAQTPRTTTTAAGAPERAPPPHVT